MNSVKGTVCPSTLIPLPRKFPHIPLARQRACWQKVAVSAKFQKQTVEPHRL